MINHIHKFHDSTLTLYHIFLKKDEVRTFKAEAAADCVATIYIHGYIIPVGDSGPVIEEHRNLRKREVWGVWNSEKDTTPENVFQAGPEGAEWLCFSGVQDVDLVQMKDSLVVPAGKGVAIGWVETVVKTETQAYRTADYIYPQDKEYTIYGTADILLVTE